VAKCRHGCEEAHIRVWASGGSVEFPGEQEQDLCAKHWMDMRAIGDKRIVLVLNQVLAAKLLWAKMYDYYPAPWNEAEDIRGFARGGVVMHGNEGSIEELTDRRTGWLGKEFRFTIPTAADMVREHGGRLTGG
jgi:hypothetical protein